MSYLSSIQASLAAQVGPVAGAPEVTEEQVLRWPALTEVCSMDQTPEGKKRQRWGIMLSFDGPKCKAGLLAKAEGLSCWKSGPDWIACLDALEAALKDGTCEWRKMGRR